MNLVERLNPANWFQRRSVDNATLRRLDDYIGLYAGTESSAGVKVTERQALEVATVFACVRVISEGCASLPVRVMQNDGATRRPVFDHPVARLLNKTPNEIQTGLEFREFLLMHAVLTGNGFAFKVRGARGDVQELFPLTSDQVTVTQDPDGKVRYDVSDDKQNVIGRYTSRDILHLKGPARLSYVGMNSVRVAREAIGLSIATERSQGKLHANGGRPAGLLSTDQKLAPEQLQNLREAWKKAFSGNNAFRTAVLDAGFKYMPLAMSGVDSQHLETRRFQIEEICRAFNVSPQMVMHTDKTSTYASAEAFFAAHVRHTLRPWLRRCEQVFDRHLLEGQPSLETQHDIRDLTKASTADREKFYRTMAETGIMTRNELRELEGLPPMPGLDEPLTPMNMETGTQSNADES